MRLNKLLAQHLNISRRSADLLIKSGRVSFNDKKASIGIDISDINTVKVDGKKLPPAKSFKYIKLNKPIGYVCSRRGQGSHTIYELLPNELQDLNPIGRLDKDSSGLLLMSNDGAYINLMAHPTFSKVKIYRVTLDQDLTNADKNKIENGSVKLADGVSRFKIISNGKNLEAHLVEGRNRQIRRTFKALNYNVTQLERIQFGNYRLDGLKKSQFQPINKDM